MVIIFSLLTLFTHFPDQVRKILISLAYPLETLIQILKDNQLIVPIVQLIAAIIAFLAVVWTQKKTHERTEREIQARLEHQQAQNIQSEKQKNKENKLKKIEEIFEQAQSARKLYNHLSKELSKAQNEDNHNWESINIMVNTTLEEASISQARVELLAKIYLNNNDLPSEWIRLTTIQAIASYRKLPLDLYITAMRKHTLLIINEINTIFDKLSNHAHQNE